MRGKIDPDEWTRRRLELFKKYTRPSIESQTVKDFEWVILVDDETEDKIIKELEMTDARMIVRRTSVTGIIDERYLESSLDIDREIRSIVSEDVPDILITTKLDSDDAVFPLFIEMIRDEAARHFGVIDFLLGSVYVDEADEAYYLYRCQSHCLASPFVSVSSDLRGSSGDFEHCSSYWHCLMGGLFPARLICTSRPAYMRVVHGGNVINTLGLFLEKESADLSEIRKTFRMRDGYT
jgi:hypothetical protein